MALACDGVRNDATDYNAHIHAAGVGTSPEDFSKRPFLTQSSAAEVQIHLLIVPELLRLLIFYHSETQDLWLTFPEPGDEQSVEYEKGLRRGIVVAEAGALIAFILRRSQSLTAFSDLHAEATEKASTPSDFRAVVQMAAASIGGVISKDDRQQSGSLLGRLPKALWNSQ